MICQDSVHKSPSKVKGLAILNPDIDHETSGKNYHRDNSCIIPTGVSWLYTFHDHKMSITQGGI